jgi:hypothetical protein
MARGAEAVSIIGPPQLRSCQLLAAIHRKHFLAHPADRRHTLPCPPCHPPTCLQAFLNSDAVKAVFNQTNSALSALSVLKKICDHPALLSKRAEQGIVSGGGWVGPF